MELKIINKELLKELTSKANANERKRANYNFHEREDDSVQRFFNALEPGTYIRPHRHSGSDKWELIMALSGSLLLIVFDDQGRILSRTKLGTLDAIGMEIPENTWHTVVSLENGTTMFECKRGPYKPTKENDFAPWAPTENSPAIGAFKDWLNDGKLDSFPPDQTQ